MVQFELSKSNDGKKRSGGNPRGFGLGDLVTVVSLINWSVERFKKLTCVVIFPNDPLSFIIMQVWFYNFESKERQHSQLWEFDQKAEGKKEEEKSSREQKTQEGHVSSAFLGNFGDNTSDEW